ncbi:MAG: hypothetical protein M4579_000417 [Chaenotheca gracillima]|nr:MAG: hypothetical protein M4579_000417 [Chaenotheca gracillima]
MSTQSHSSAIPRLIVHGGAGNITRKNLPPAQWRAYRTALLSILRSTRALLAKPDTTAIDAATHAVTLLEDIPLFNASHGAVFTRAGTTELEASVMVSRGKRKRGCGVILLRKVKHPILLAKEMLLRGEADDGGGAYGHVQLAGTEAERLAEQWGLEMVDPGYFWTKKRWEEHLRGLEKESCVSESGVKGNPSWDAEEYLPQGTVGCVVMDQWGTVCVATSTGGITNKLEGRIGDTPTLGAGFWAEEWTGETISSGPLYSQPAPPRVAAPGGDLLSFLGDCLPGFPSSSSTSYEASEQWSEKGRSAYTRAVATGGTGNGDSFLRLSACRSAASIARFSSHPLRSLQSAVTQIAGPGGELQQSAGDRWHKTGEGEGGMIGIEVVTDANGIKGSVVADFNCGGLFRVWVDDRGKERAMVFRDEYPEAEEADVAR